LRKVTQAFRLRVPDLRQECLSSDFLIPCGKSGIFLENDLAHFGASFQCSTSFQLVFVASKMLALLFSTNIVPNHFPAGSGSLNLKVKG